MIKGISQVSLIGLSAKKSTDNWLSVRFLGVVAIFSAIYRRLTFFKSQKASVNDLSLSLSSLSLSLSLWLSGVFILLFLHLFYVLFSQTLKKRELFSKFPVSISSARRLAAQNLPDHRHSSRQDPCPQRPICHPCYE